MKIKVGDLVSRYSYGNDVLFEIKAIYKFGYKAIAELSAITIRFSATALLEDLCIENLSRSSVNKISLNEIDKRLKKVLDNRYKYLNKFNYSFEKVPKLLHIDGDERYMNYCKYAYERLSMNAVCVYVKEPEQPNNIIKLLSKANPQMLIITGHDIFKKNSIEYSDLNEYRNSKYFIDSVINARIYEPNIDSLVIFSGACQSCYEPMIRYGANFASSPDRKLIHCLDPVLTMEKIAYTHMSSLVSPIIAVENTFCGSYGIGGIDTKGQLRLGYPISSLF